MPEVLQNAYPSFKGMDDHDLSIDDALSMNQEQQTAPPKWNLSPLPSIPSGNDIKEESYDDKIASGFDNLATKATAPNPFDTMYTAESNVPKGTEGRYKNYYYGYNTENISHNQQGTLEAIGKSAANMLTSFSKTLVQGITGPLAGVGYMLTGTKDEGFVNNPYNKWLETWDNAKYPIYESDARKNASWYSPTYWMSANALNSTLSTIGDLAAFYVTGLAAGAPLSAIGKVGEGVMGAKYINNINKVAELTAALPEGAEGTAAVKELQEGLGKITSQGWNDAQKLEASEQLMTDISRKYSTGVQAFNKFQQAAIGTVTNLGMAQSSALSSSTSFRNKMLQEIHDKGREPTDEEIKSIDEAAKHVGGVTGAIMTVMGAVTLHGIWKGILAKKDGELLVRNEIQELAEGSVKAGTGGVEREYTKQASTGFVNKSLSALKKVNKYVEVMPAIGMMEFGLAPASVESYYDKKYHEPDSSVLEGLQDAIGDNVKGMFTKEGASTFFLGLFSAALLPMSIKNKIREGREADKNTQSALTALNTTYLKSYLKASVNTAKRGTVLQEEYLEAIRNGDKDTEMDLRQQQLENYLYPRIKYGQKSFIDKDIEGYKKLLTTEEGIKQLQSDGIVPEGDNIVKIREDFTKHLDEVQKYTDNAENYYKALTLKYGGVINKEGKRLYDDEHIEKLMFLSGAIDDSTSRIKTLSDQISESELSTNPEFQKRFGSLVGVFNKLKDNEAIIGHLGKGESAALFKLIDNLSINPDAKDELSKKFAGFLKLNVRKKQYLAEYENIISDPEKYKDTITENPAGAQTEIPEAKPGEVPNDTTHIQDVRTRNKQPLDLKIGDEYYAGQQITPGKGPDGELTRFRKFSRFTVTGQSVNDKGERLVHIKTEEGEYSVPESTFSKYKLGKVSDVEKNHNAKYFLNNINSVYEFNFGKGKKLRGRLNYDPEENEFSFVYQENGKRRETVVTKDQFRKQPQRNEKGEPILDGEGKPILHETARLTKVGEITEADKEFLKSKESEKELQKKEAQVKGRLSIIREIIDTKKEALKKVEDDILDHEIKLESAQKQLTETKLQLEQGTTRTSVDHKRHFRSLINTADTVSRTINELQNHIKTLTEHSDELKYEISYLDDISVEDLPNGRLLLEFLKDNRKDLEDAVLETGLKINKISKFIDDAKETLSSIVESILSRINLFEKKYLGGEPYSDKTVLKDYVNRQAQDKKDFGYMTEGEGNEISSDFLHELSVLKGAVSEAEEFNIPENESDIKSTLKEIDTLYDKLKTLGRDIKIHNEVYDKFKQKLKEFEIQQAKKLIFDTPEAHKKLYGLQYNINKNALGSEPLNDPKEWQKDKEQKPEQKKLRNITSVFKGSMVMAEGQENTPSYQAHNKWYERYNRFLANINFIGTQVTEGHANPDNLKVMLITRKNQHHFFSTDFIPESYTHPYTGKEVSNDNTESGAVHMVIVEHDPVTDKVYTVDENGKRLSELGEKQDPNNFIYTKLNSSAANTGGGFQKYHIPEGVDEQAVLNEAKAQREQLFQDSSQPKLWDFTQSRGLENVPRDDKNYPKELNNSVTEAGLVPTENLDGTIKIYTLSESENSSMAIAEHGDVGIKVPVGFPFLKYKDNFILLNNKKFSAAEQENLYKVIKAMADNYIKNNGKIDKVFTDYLSGVLYFKSPFASDTSISRNQLWFNEHGELVLGTNKIAIKFHPDDIEADEIKIKAFLSGVFHGTSKALLNGDPFTEITDIDKNGNPVTRVWKNYTRYLVSDRYDIEGEGAGKKRTETLPLSVNIKSQENSGPMDTPFKNKYITLKDYGDFHKTLPVSEEVQKPEIKSESSVSTSGTKTYKSSPNSSNEFHYTLDGDKLTIHTVTVSGEDMTMEQFDKKYLLDPALREQTLINLKKSILDYDKTLKVPEILNEVVPEIKEIIPEEPTTEDKVQRHLEIDKNFEDMLKGDGNDGPVNYRELSEKEEIKERENIEEVRKFFEDTLPSIKFEDVPNLIKTGKGSYAWGQYHAQYVKVFKNAPYGTGYHEAFHAVRDSFLSDKQWLDLLTEFKNRTGSYTDRFGNTIEHSKATEHQAEEQIAEEFRLYKIKNREYTKSSQITNFFRRLWNFMQGIFGKPESIEGVFKKMNSSYYKGISSNIRNSEPMNSAMKDISPENRKDIIQGIAWRIIYNLRTNYGDLVRMTEGKLSVREMFEPALKELNEYYTNPKKDNGVYAFAKEMIKSGEDLNIVKDKVKSAIDLWNDHVVADKENVIQDLTSFFRKHRIIFKKVNTPEENTELEAIKEDEVDNQERENFNITFWDDKDDRNYDRDTFSIDAKKNAPIEIKLMFSFLTQTENNPNKGGFGDLVYPKEKMNSFMQPELVDSQKMFYKVMDATSGILGLDNIKNKLKTLARKVPELVRVYNSLFAPKMSLNNAKLQLKYERTFQKQRPSPLYWHITEDNVSHIVDTDFAEASKQVLEQWDANLKRKPFSQYDHTDKSYKIDTSKIRSVPKDNKTTAAFLREIGFDISDKNFDEIDKKKYSPIEDAQQLLSMMKRGDVIKPLTSFEASGPITRLTEAIADAEGVNHGTQYLNMGGNMVQSNVQYNFTGRVIASINSAGTLDNLFKLFPRLKNDKWSRNSQLLKKGGVLFDQQGTLVSGPRITVMIGLDNEQDSYNPKTETVSMNKVTRFMADLNMILGRRGKGNYNMSINADSNTDWGMMLNHYITQEDLTSKRYTEKAQTIFKGYLADEIDLIKDNIAGDRILTENAIKADNYKKLQIFKDILSQKMKDLIDEHVENNNISTDEFIKKYKDNINEDLWNFVDKQVQKQKKFLEDYQILSPNGRGEFRFHKINSDFTEGISTSKNANGDVFLTDEQVNDILKFRTLNNDIHTIELHKLMFGPFYEILDPEKRHKNFNSPVDLTHTDKESGTKLNDYFNSHLNFAFPEWSSDEQKRINSGVQLQPGELGYQEFKDNFHAFTFDHDKGIHSEYANEIIEAIGKLGNKYETAEEMDAQGIILDTAHREYKLKQGGEWTEDAERQHQYDMAAVRESYYKRNPDKVYRSELKEADQKILANGNPHIFGVGTVLKPLGAGMMDNAEQSIPFIFKTSVFRLSYPLAKGLGLEDMYWWMHDNNISIVGPKSWQKVGRMYDPELKGLPELYKQENGKFSFGLSDITSDQVNPLKMSIKWDDFNKIVETDKSKTGQTKGSQLMSIAIMNSFDNGLPVDFYNSDKDDYKTKLYEWNALQTESAKEKASERYKLFRDNMRSLQGLTINGYNEALDILGIHEKDGEFTFANPQKVVDFLKNEITRRDLPENIADSLNWKYNSDTKEDELYYPIEALPNYQQLRDMLWSVVDKNVLRQKLNGTNYTMVSSTLFEKSGREGVYKGKDGKYHKIEDYNKLSDAEKKTVKLSSSELHFYKRGKNGSSTSRMQVKVGNPFRLKLQQWALKNDKEIPSDAELLKFLKTGEGKKLLTGIGFRVPTQGMNSVDSIEIVEFLPPEMGDAIVVPSEIVTKAGSDFDIDKLGVYHYNFTIDDKGYPHIVKFIDDTSNKENLKELYNRTYSKKDREGISEAKLLSGIFKTKDIGENVPTFEEFVKAHENTDPYPLNSREALENRYFETLDKILTHPDNYEQLVTPNSTDQMTSIERDINTLLYPEGVKRDKNDIDFTRLMDPVYMAEQRQLYLEAKRTLIGIGAQNNTFHALSQTQYIPLENMKDVAPEEDLPYLGDFKVYLPHRQLKNGSERLTMYSGLKDSVGNFISDKISQYINGAVDAVKDIWLMRLIKSKELMSTAIFLDRVGVDAKYTFYFINQPAIQEYIKQDTINKAVRGLDTDREFKFKDDIINLVNQKFSGGADEKEPTEFTFDQLQEALKKEGKGNLFTDSDNAFQRKVLREFLKYNTYANHSLQEQMGVMYGNMKSPTDKDMIIKNAHTERAIKSSAIRSTEKILDNTFQGTVRKKINDMVRAMKTIIRITDHPALKGIHETFSNPEMRLKSDDKTAILDRADISLMDYAVQNYIRKEGKSLNKFISELLVDTNTSVATILDQNRKDLKGDIRTLLVDTLADLQTSLKSGNLRNIKLFKKSTTAFESDNFTESLRELRDNPQTSDLYNKILTLGFLQSGIRDSMNAFNKYIPHEDYVKYMKPAIDKLMSNYTGGFEDTMGFYRNNWYDKNTVPRAKKRYFEIAAGAKDTIQGKAPEILKVHRKSNNRRFDVVKTIDIGTNPITGKKYTDTEISEMKRKGNNSFWTTKLYQKVYDPNTGMELMKGDDYLYKQINAWGDGTNLQEYYEKGQPSVLDIHDKVTELEDYQITDIVNHGKSIPVPEMNTLKEENLKTENKPVRC